mgnify:CR=1 FL=1
MALNVERIYLPDDDDELDTVFDVSEDWVVGRLTEAVTTALPPVLFVGGVCAAARRRRPATAEDHADAVIRDAAVAGSAA